MARPRREDVIARAQAEAIADEIATGNDNLNFDTAEILKSFEGSTEFASRTAQTGGDMITIYRLVDGMPSDIPEFMLRNHLRRRWTPEHVQESHLDPKIIGSAVWTTEKDRAPKWSREGRFPCPFSSASTVRDELEAAGVGSAFCNKPGFTTQLAATSHARTRHRQEFAAWQEYREELRNKEYEERFAKNESRMIDLIERLGAQN